MQPVTLVFLLIVIHFRCIFYCFNCLLSVIV